MRPHVGPRLEAGRLLATRAVVAVLTERHPDQVRRHCAPVACDVATRVPLYDVDEVAALLAALRRRVA